MKEKLIILQKDISKNKLSKILENLNNQNSQVFAHKSLQDKVPPNYNVIFYPTNISTFQKMTQKFHVTESAIISESRGGVRNSTFSCVLKHSSNII